MTNSGQDRTCTVSFAPSGSKAEVPIGVTILAAAREAGVYVENLCGGEGVCGKCRVIVRSGIVRGETTNYLTREEIKEGYVLACEGRVGGDLLVDVPPESQLYGRVREPDIAELRLKQRTVLERQPAKLDPPVNKYHFTVPPATLENSRADMERLEHELRKVNGGGHYQAGLKVGQRLPGAIRASNGEVTVTVAHRGALNEIVDVVGGDRSKPNLAVAVDVGTTSVIAHLVEVSTGQTLGTDAKYNSQAAYGADVLRRIIHCTEHPDGLAQLHAMVTDDINILIQELLNKFRLSKNYVTQVVIAGNTTILHTVLGLNPEWIRREPYVGVTYSPPPFRAAELGITISPRGLVYSMPCVSSFVGGDITAGVLATGLHESDAPRMLIDIGTNGEIVIGNKDWMVCASASAGPAFEGGETRDGMRATRGAIDHLRGWRVGHPFTFSTVGDEAPCGLCGTAYVDLLVQMLRLGVMDKTGRINTDNGVDRIRKGVDDVLEFVVLEAGEKGATRQLAITQNDIANLLRAKAAVYAATKVLLNSLGLQMSDLKEILVAGAFGNFLDLENAVAIGLLPDVPGERLRFVGNACIIGAKMAALSRERYDEAQQIANAMTYFELSTDPTFMEAFTSACFFPHTNIEEFPSVMATMS
ncbi:MAG: DUF4445 domain-containing protein [Nitrospiraceae bacterium]|nr:DUF4445 domain-containing protein [Nitrospiraceae bacterium]